MQYLHITKQWIHPWTILELKYIHIAPQMSSYVNVKAINLITLFFGFVQV